MEILARINREQGITVLVSLHQVQFARRYCRRAVALRLGEVVFDGACEQLTPRMLHDLYGSAVDELMEGTHSLDHVTDDPLLGAALGAGAAASI